MIIESNIKMKTHAGFTIGPILDVMSHSKKTRELWFGSYFFSWFMEILYMELNDSEINFLTPYIDKINPYSKAGKFPDRFVLTSQSEPEKIYEKIKKANDNAFEYFTNLIFDQAKKPLMDKDTLQNVLKNYIQTRFFVIDSDSIDENKNIIGQVDKYLNSMEQSFTFMPGKSGNTCQRCKTLPSFVKIEEKKNIIKLCPLCFIKYRCNTCKELRAKIGINPDTDKKKSIVFQTLQEIAAKDIFEQHADILDKLEKDKDDDISFEEIQNEIKNEKEKNKVQPCHKYFAIIQADGDDLGNLAGEIDNPAELSRRLSEFTEEAEKIINKFGVPVFLGGDDILAFTPVYSNDKNVIDLIKNLSKAYQEKVDKNTNKTSLSFGINVVYYKFPLSTALKQARDLLFGNAKKYPGKDAVAISLTKHSGSQTGFTLKINSEKFQFFSNMITDVLKEEKPVMIPGGIHYNLKRFEAILANMKNKDQLEAFFENNFNEPGHEKFEGGIKEVKELFKKFLFKGKDQQDEVSDVLNILKFMKFLTGDNK